MFGFNGQEKDDEISGVGNALSFEYRIHDTRLGRFLSVDPLARSYPWNSAYTFAENRPIDGRDLEGREWENFMSGFDKPGKLKIKLPNFQTAQSQMYIVQVANSTMTFEDFKKTFKEAPQGYLSNSKATFNTPVDGEGKPSQFVKGSYIRIDIEGPMNNSYVQVWDIKEDEHGSLLVTFVTLEGHVEKGMIMFKLSQDKEGNISFTIASKSEVDYASVPDGYAREQQQKSWEEVLTNVVTKLGGEEKDRKIIITDPSSKDSPQENIEKEGKDTVK